MKYNSTNKPLVCMQTQSVCYKKTVTMPIRGVLWHSTAANNKSLKRYVQPSDVRPKEDTYDKAKWLELLGVNAYGNDWNHIEREAGLNCWIGALADGTVTTIQTMPWDFKPWGCGSGPKGSCNNGWIQFEICEDDLTDKKYFNTVYQEACEITAYLCKLYNIDPLGTVFMNGVQVPTILCHKDSNNLGLGSNHGDVMHWFPKYGKSMETARNDIAALLKESGAIQTQPTVTATVKTYKVVTPINMYVSAGDAKSQKNSKGTVVVGTYYIYNKYPNGYSGVYNITTDKTGAVPSYWINPIENVLIEDTTEAEKVHIETNIKIETTKQEELDTQINPEVVEPMNNTNNENNTTIDTDISDSLNQDKIDVIYEDEGLINSEELFNQEDIEESIEDPSETIENSKAKIIDSAFKCLGRLIQNLINLFNSKKGE